MANQKHLDILLSGMEAWNSWRKENPDITPDLSGIHSPSSDFSGYNLSNSDLTQANLSKASLQNANLQGALLMRIDLSAADLSGANITQADLRYAILNNINLSDANLNEADLESAQLSAAILENAKLDGVNLHRSDLQDANFQSASLNRSVISKSNLSNVNFQEALLSETNLQNSDLTAANFQSANLSQADLQKCYFQKNNLKNAFFNDANFSKANFEAVCFADGNFSRSDFSSANLYGSDLRDAVFFEADFTDANLSQTNMASGIFHNVNFRDSNLSNALAGAADFRGSQFRETIFFKCDLKKANFSECFLHRPALKEALLEGSIQEDLQIMQYNDCQLTVDGLPSVHALQALLEDSETETIEQDWGKLILIVGDFPAERHAMLDALLGVVRKQEIVPVVLNGAPEQISQRADLLAALASHMPLIVIDLTTSPDIPGSFQEIADRLPNNCVLPLIHAAHYRYEMTGELAQYAWAMPLKQYKSEKSLQTIIRLQLKALKDRLLSEDTQADRTLEAAAPADPEVAENSEDSESAAEAVVTEPLEALDEVSLSNDEEALETTEEDSPPAEIDENTKEDSSPAEADEDGAEEDSPPGEVDDDDTKEIFPPSEADDDAEEDSPPAETDDDELEKISPAQHLIEAENKDSVEDEAEYLSSSSETKKKKGVGGSFINIMLIMLFLFGAYWGWTHLYKDVLIMVPSDTRAYLYFNGEEITPSDYQDTHTSYRLERKLIGSHELVILPTQLEDIKTHEFVRYQRYQKTIEVPFAADSVLHEVIFDTLYSVRKILEGRYPTINSAGDKVIYSTAEPQTGLNKKLLIYNLSDNSEMEIKLDDPWLYLPGWEWDRAYLLDDNESIYLSAFNFKKDQAIPFHISANNGATRKIALDVKKKWLKYVPLQENKGIALENKLYSIDGEPLKNFTSNRPFKEALYSAGNSGLLYFTEATGRSKGMFSLECQFVSAETSQSKPLFSLIQHRIPFLSAGQNGERVVMTEYSGVSIEFLSTIRIWEGGEWADLTQKMIDGDRRDGENYFFHKTEAVCDGDARKIVYEYDRNIYLIEIPEGITVQDIKAAEVNKRHQRRS